jgi:glycosyltransferase involved in cell wall biosynthesis
MHLLIDGQALQTASSRQRGIGRYTCNLLRGLSAVRPQWRIEVVQSSALKPIAADNLHGLPAVSFQPPVPPYIDFQEINERYYADWLTAQGADGVLVPSYCEGWDAILPSFCGPRPRLFGVVYDLIPLLYPEHYLPDLHTSHWYAHRFRQLLQCDALLSDSEAVARDVRVLGGSTAPPVINIGGAVDPSFVPLARSELAARAPEIRERYALPREFLLYVGATDYRKNLHGAIRAFAALPTECRANLDFAVVCRMKPAERETAQAWAFQAGVAAELRLICSANDEDLRALYLMCRLFFFPSLYEGLGLPVLEALHCGAPVATSNCSSLPEYAGSHSWLCDPTSPQAMAHVLGQALAEPRDVRRHARQQFAETFSWKNTAERACTVMEGIIRRRVHSVRQRRRLAWVLPLTKNLRRMSEHTVELLSLLAKRFDIELIATSDPREVPQTLLRRHLILTTREVPTRHAALPYDMFVYQSGLPPMSLHMLRLARKFPGLVLRCHFFAMNLRRVAAALIDRIDRTIRRHEQSDGPWRDCAIRCLAECDAADAIIDSWAALRVQGQQRFAARRTDPFSSRSESAAML